MVRNQDNSLQITYFFNIKHHPKLDVSLSNNGLPFLSKLTFNWRSHEKIPANMATIKKNVEIPIAQRGVRK